MRKPSAVFAVMLIALPAARADLIYDNGMVNFFSGHEREWVGVHDNPTPPPLTTTLNVTGGFMGSLLADDTSIVNIYSGVIDSADGMGYPWYGLFQVSAGATANVYGGYIGYGIVGQGAIHLFGGSTGNVVVGLGGSGVLRGGTVRQSVAVYGGTIEIWGGGFEYLYSSTTLGGTDPGTVFIYGTNFNYPVGPLEDLTGVITGVLSDGTGLAAHFTRYGYLQSPPGNIVLIDVSAVPEPSTLALMCFVGAVLLGWLKPHR